MKATPIDVTSDDLLARVLSSLDDDKAEDVVAIDLRGRSSVADHMVICSGRSSRQVAAIAEKLVERLKHEFGRACRIETLTAAGAPSWRDLDARRWRLVGRFAAMASIARRPTRWLLRLVLRVLGAG